MIRSLAAIGLVVIGFTACDRPKSSPPARPAAVSNSNLPSPPRPGSGPGEVSKLENLSTIHWLGKKRVAADTNAAGAMAIWNLPESAKLGAQTLDKLALAPWRLLKGDSATNGAPVALLRPLLDDLVVEETRLTIHHPTNQPGGDWALAVKLPADRAGLWHTNLAAVLASLTGAKPEYAVDGFTCPSSILNPQSSNAVFRLNRTNDWTILTFATRNSELVTGLLNSALRPPPSAFTNWLSFSLDLAAINRAFALGWSLPANSGRVALQVAGDGASVSTRGTLAFATPARIELGPWNTPTNLIQDPLTGLTAVRGLRSLASAFGATGWLTGPNAPEQAFFWQVGNIPFLTFLALPQTNAHQLAASVRDQLVAEKSRLFGRKIVGEFENQSLPQDGILVTWKNPPFMTPFLTVTNDASLPVLFAGLFPLPQAGRPLPPALLAQFQANDRLVLYDWEMSDIRARGFVDAGQLLRLSLGWPQVPPDGSMAWLVGISDLLGNCTTSVTVDAAGNLEFRRSSTIGLSALELNLLADWLASPNFPSGLHTLRATSKFAPANFPPPPR